MNAHQHVRSQGWRSDRHRLVYRHTTGATAVLGEAGWRATRAGGDEIGGLQSRADALAWALGEPPPERQVPRERPVKDRARQAAGDEWEGPVRRLLRHRNGTVDLGPVTASPKIAQLRSGERRTFRAEADAKVWVAGNGVFPPGYVPAERRGG